jgi:hypothetical protein
MRVFAASWVIWLVVAAPPPAWSAGKDTSDEGLLREASRSDAAAAKLALRARSAGLAWAAFGAFIRQTKDLDAAASVKFVRAFARRKGMFWKACLLASFHRRHNRLTAELVEQGDETVAAGIALCAAQGAYLAEQAERSYRPAPGLDVDPKRRERRLARFARAKERVKIPPALFASRDRAVLCMAVLAAAYAGQPDLKGAVNGVEKVTPAVQAAKALYLAQIGEVLDAEALKPVFEANWEFARPVRTAAPELSATDLGVPGLCTLCEAMGRMKQKGHLGLLHQALSHPDLRVRVEAARAVRRIGAPESVPVLLQRLADCQWPLLSEVAAALGAMPDARSVRPLILRLAKEKGRFRLDLVYALSSIAGGQKGRTTADWAAWWKKESDRFEVDPEATATYREATRVQDVDVPRLGIFYGLPIYSDRMCYVVDTSKSMQGDRIASLRTNMKESITQLAGHVRFNIVDFGGNVIALYDRSLVSGKRAAIKRVETMPLTFGTRSFDAMERAAMFETLDTLYFLSDGAPYYGQTDDWPDILTAVRLMTRYRPLAIFCIDFDPTAKNKRYMERLAAENYGRSESIVVAGN